MTKILTLKFMGRPQDVTKKFNVLMHIGISTLITTVEA